MSKPSKLSFASLAYFTDPGPRVESAASSPVAVSRGPRQPSTESEATLVVAPRAPDPAPWPVGWRVASRFVFAYWILYVFPFPIGSLPFTERLAEVIVKGQNVLVPWFGRHALHLNGPAQWHPTGSGDTLYSWVLVLLTSILAALATIVWSLVTRRREHRQVHRLVRVYLRYTLASSMLIYGLSKVLPVQFAANDPARLMEPYGSFSPMGAVWALMGASAPYTIAAGLGETIGGLLLFFRRTATVGALVLLAILGNVVLINFCYDVPVKLYSLHLWLMALFLAGPDLRTMYHALVRRHPVQPAEVDGRPVARRWLIAMRVGKGLLVSWLVFSTARSIWKVYHEYGNGRVARPFEGIWEVDEISSGGPHWHRIGIGIWRAAVASSEEPYTVYGVEYDEKQSLLTLLQMNYKASFAIRLANERHLALEGPFTMRLHRVDPSQILLASRGFHWVQEYPLNR